MTTTKTTIIYHSGDFDGIFCREIAHHFLGDKAEYIGWNFGDPKIPFPKEGPVYILDLSPECLEAQVPNPPETDCLSRMIWIDHHKTSIEKWNPNIPGYRIDGVAACRLAWQWFQHPACRKLSPFPKEDFTERRVVEPLAVRLAGEYDIWDKRDPDAETFQYALRVSPLTPAGWTELFNMKMNETVQVTEGEIMVRGMLVAGRVAQSYAQLTDAEVCNSRTWIMEWEGLKFLCVNSARFNSLLFAAKDVPETGHDALLGFYFNGKVWTVSLYHAKHRTDLDLSVIVQKHGGGGHRGACGFTCDKPPFLT